MPSLVDEFCRVRALTEALIAGLTPEDCLLQAIPEVSPAKWHLGHTSWFFETFVLAAHAPDYRTPAVAYRELFNSYYQAVGPRGPRAERGLLSRPTLPEVLEYRRHVDRGVLGLLEGSSDGAPIADLVLLGLQHEQQHQELLVMDMKLNFSKNPLLPAYRSEPLPAAQQSPPLAFRAFEGGLLYFGNDGSSFSFDNERPAHRRFIEPFALATRLVTNAEMLAFVESGGYQTPALWLSDGWDWVQQDRIQMPLYWRRAADGSYFEFTAHGELPLEPSAPVCHVSAYEAAAYASFAGARLPTEFEWELSARVATSDAQPRCLEDFVLHPRAAEKAELSQLFGDVWQWTRSAYEPYPGFAPGPGALAEYNGKFMCNQQVLRGSSVATPRGHARSTYRNFYYPHQRWPFTGIRLAREAS